MTKEDHLLLCLSEECVEASKVIHKILRFGLTDINPKFNLTNLEELRLELNDILALIDNLQWIGTLPRNIRDEELINLKKTKLTKMMEYSITKDKLEI